MPGPRTTYAPDRPANGAAPPHKDSAAPNERTPSGRIPSGRNPPGHIPSGLANAVLAQLPLAVAVVTADLRLLYWNEPGASLFGVPSLLAADMPPLTQILTGMPALTQQQRDKVVTFVANSIAASDRAEPDTCLRISLGRDRRMLLQVRGVGGRRWMLSIDDGRLLAASGKNGLAFGDPWLDSLTGLSNRRHFNNALRDLTENAAPDSRHALLLIDLDRFKPINDTLGHSVGDAMLCLVARRLQRETRENDLLVRLGGDEFAILLSNVDMAEPLATRVIDVLCRPFLIDGQIASIGASVGIVRFPEHGSTADDLMRNADLALYDAKAAGRRTWRLFAPALAAKAHWRREMETDLRKALMLGELSVAYQPQLNVRTQALSGFEALLRWTHPVRGVVPPAEFIPIAEDIGCIAALGEWVLKTACMEATHWPAPLSVAVNVSPRQMEHSEKLFEAVQSALRGSGLAPERLELEITESSLLCQEEHVLETLHRLRASGIRIAMDDFGTGYSSLGQLRSFPFDKIKIDRSFIASLGHDADSVAVIRAIAAMGAGLGMTTTAEGVETSEQAALVEADGCTDIQGYLISRPVPPESISDLLLLYNKISKPVASQA